MNTLAVPAAKLPQAGAAPRALRPATGEAPWVRAALIVTALVFLTLFLFVPLAAVFVEAFKKGWDVYWAAITEPDARSAIALTLLAAGISVPLNLVFGDRLSFWGAIDQQNLLPNGSADEIEADVAEKIRILGAGGGYMVAPAHIIQSDVSMENVEAFIAAAKKHGAAAR